MTQAPVAQWIERLFPKQKAVGSTPTWRDFSCVVFFLRNGDWLFFLKVIIMSFYIFWKMKIF